MNPSAERLIHVENKSVDESGQGILPAFALQIVTVYSSDLVQRFLNN